VRSSDIIPVSVSVPGACILARLPTIYHICWLPSPPRRQPKSVRVPSASLCASPKNTYIPPRGLSTPACHFASPSPTRTPTHAAMAGQSNGRAKKPTKAAPNGKANGHMNGHANGHADKARTGPAAQTNARRKPRTSWTRGFTNVLARYVALSKHLRNRRACTEAAHTHCRLPLHLAAC
jgi:hypothetical protein